MRWLSIAACEQLQTAHACTGGASGLPKSVHMSMHGINAAMSKDFSSADMQATHRKTTPNCCNPYPRSGLFKYSTVYCKHVVHVCAQAHWMANQEPHCMRSAPYHAYTCQVASYSYLDLEVGMGSWSESPFRFFPCVGPSASCPTDEPDSVAGSVVPVGGTSACWMPILS